MCDGGSERSVAFTVLSTGKRLALSPDVKVFKSPYGLLDEPSARDRSAQRDALKVRHIASHFISNAAEGHAFLDDLLLHLKSFFPNDRLDFAVGCMKCSVAVGAFSVDAKFKANPKKLVLSMSPHQQDQERRAVFSASFADELQAQASRIETLIRHWPTVGSFREELLRVLLQKSLPNRYHVATGFLYGSPRQIDILIYDCIDYAPLFRAGDLVVVERAAVRAVIEVKSTLNHAELRSSLLLLDELDTSLDGDAPIFRGIFAYRSSISTSAIMDTMIGVYRNEDLEEGVQLMNLSQIVTAVCVQKETLILSGINMLKLKGEMFVPMLFAIESDLERTPQVALFLDTLKNYLRGSAAAVERGADLASFIELELKRVDTKNVYDKFWGPYIARHYEEYEGTEVRAEATALIRWRRGNAWKLERPLSE
jgi:hypothetical protein